MGGGVFLRKLLLKRRKIFPFAAGLLISAFAFMLTLYIALSPVFFSVAETLCENRARNMLYSAVLSVSEKEDFADLSDTTVQDGRITGIRLNSKKANTIRALIASKANQLMSEEGYQTCFIPAGNLTNIPLLSGRGFKIPLRIVPLGSVDADIVSDFSGAGINQTKHSVFIKATVNLRVMAPFNSAVTRAETIIPLTETVIVGDVPHLYADREK